MHATAARSSARSRAVLCLLGAVVASAASARAETPVATLSAEARDLVQRLGASRDPDPLETVRQLHGYGRPVVPALIAELRVIDPDPTEANHDEWWHMVRCVWALEGLTGKSFSFHTEESLSEGLAEFDPRGPYGYFTYWMSHSRVWVAPRDVQRKVIAAWHEWCAAHCSSFEVQRFNAVVGWAF